MLQVATSEPYWSGAAAELNMSFENLRDYQWKRLLTALWSHPKITGPFAVRYSPGETVPPTIAYITPEFSVAFRQFGIITLAEGVQVGIRVLATRSLFECVSVHVPLNMFANVTANSDDPGLQIIEKAFYDLALCIYEFTTYYLAVIGVNREFQLLGDLMSNDQQRYQLLKSGNFLARDDTLAALRVQPALYKKVMPSLRWCPPGSSRR